MDEPYELYNKETEKVVSTSLMPKLLANASNLHLIGQGSNCRWRRKTECTCGSVMCICHWGKNA